MEQPDNGSGHAAGPPPPHHLGERAQLSKAFRPQWIWAIALGSAVGWGAFVLPIDWMSTAGPLGAILGFLIGGVLMLVIAVSYGFLIRSFPVSGGEFAYTLVGFGRQHALLCGWFLTLGYICIIALNASALALLGRFVLPEVAELGLLYEVAGWDVYLGEVLIASAALVTFAFLNIRGTTISGRVQYVFCLIMLSGVALLLLGALLHPDSSWSNVTPVFPEGVGSVSAILAIVAIAPWAYVGFDNVPQAAEEFDFPARKAFRLIVLAIVAAAAVYAATILTTSLATSWTALAEQGPRWGTGDAIDGLYGRLGIFVLAVALSMGIFTGLNGFFVAASRLLFGMGRGRIVPGAFGRLHPRFNTPYVGIIFACVVCLVAPWFGREVLLWIVDMSAIGVTIAYTYTCLSAFRLFRWSGDDSPEPAPEGARSSTKKVFSILGALAGMSFLVLLLVPTSPAALGNPSLIALAVWIVLGAIFYVARLQANRELTDEQLHYLVLGREEIAAQDADRDTETSA